MIVRFSVVLRRTVCDDIDWHFDNLSGRHPTHDDFGSGCRSVNVITNSLSQDHTHPDDHNLPTYELITCCLCTVLFESLQTSTSVCEEADKGRLEIRVKEPTPKSGCNYHACWRSCRSRIGLGRHSRIRPSNFNVYLAHLLLCCDSSSEFQVHWLMYACHD